MSQENSSLNGQAYSDMPSINLIETSKSIGVSVTYNGCDGDVHIDSSGDLLFRGKRNHGIFSCIFGSSTPSKISKSQIVGATLESNNKFKVWYCHSSHPKGANPGLKLRTAAFDCSNQQGAEQFVHQIRQTACWWGRPEPPRAVIVINPRSGNFKSGNIWREVFQPVLVGAAGWDVKAIETQRPEHATEIVECLDMKELDVMFFLGGDGTLYEGLQGLFRRADWEEAVKIPICHVPGGTGNGVATSCGIWDALGAVRAACKGGKRGLDVASVLQAPSQRMYSVLSLTYGIVSNLEVGTEHLRWMGDGRFTYGAVREVLQRNLHSCKVAWLPAGAHYQPPSTPAAVEEAGTPRFNIGKFQHGPELPLLLHAERFWGGHIPQQLTEEVPPGWKFIQPEGTHGVEMFTISNVPYLASSYHSNPQGALDSGHMDLCWGAGGNRLQSLQTLMASEKGEHLQQPWINSDTVKALILEPVGGTSHCRVDGEVIPNTPIYLEVHPSLCCAVVAPELTAGG